MQSYLPRRVETEVVHALKRIPVVAIIGPRQCGKSTMAKKLISEYYPRAEYLDLEKYSDLNKLHDPELYFGRNSDKMICIDGIQQRPDLFSAMRSHVDEAGGNGQFLILGSASPSLLRQSSESLAGRIHYIELTPFLITEVSNDDLWLNGGYPRSLLSEDTDESFQWRQDFILTFLERDIPQLGINLPSGTLRRFWTMCAHSTGQVLNKSKLGQALGVSHTTIQRYLDILESTFMVRLLQPYYANIKKRIVKSPKLYFRDSGILHGILNISSFNDLLGHPIFGFSWECYALENILSSLHDWKAFFFRTSSGAEIDVILQRGSSIHAIEFKSTKAPRFGRYLMPLIEEIGIDRTWIVAPVEEAYPLTREITVIGISEVIDELAAKN